MGSMDTLRGLLVKQLALLLVIILLAVGVSIEVGLRWGVMAGALVLLAGFLIVFLLMRPKRLGGRS